MKDGDVVKFREPTDTEEASERFIVLELRGDRVLVGDVNTQMAIRPTFVYLCAELETV